MNIYHNKIPFLIKKKMISCLETERNTFCRIHCKINTPDPDKKYSL